MLLVVVDVDVDLIVVVVRHETVRLCDSRVLMPVVEDDDQLGWSVHLLVMELPCTVPFMILFRVVLLLLLDVLVPIDGVETFCCRRCCCNDLIHDVTRILITIFLVSTASCSCWDEGSPS